MRQDENHGQAASRREAKGLAPAATSTEAVGDARPAPRAAHIGRRWRTAALLGSVALLANGSAFAASRAPAPAPEPSVGAAKAPKAEAKKPEKAKTYYVKTRGYRLDPAPDVPDYVRELGKTYKQFEGIDWLDIGLDERVRFEYRKDDYRPWTTTYPGAAASQRRYFPDSLWLTRTRAYFGVKKALDPLRFAVEYEDARAHNGIYELQGQEINENELIQAYAELYFKDALGKDDLGNDRPLSLRAGRFHLELLDRRLIGNNQFRNTTNNFEGFRIKLGKQANDWDLDSFLMRPVRRIPYEWDRPEWGTWIYGGVLSIRRWSEYATIQPYFLGRKQYADPLNESSALRLARETYAPGLRAYGVLGDFDYDVNINKQLGQRGELRDVGARRNAVQTTVQHDAIAYAVEGGYTFSDLAWKPRVSVSYAYGSGDKSPFDSANQTFDIFYGFNQPFSRNDYFAWNNARNLKGRIEFEPIKDVKVDTAFSAYWLAGTASAWDRANLVAPLGNRGDYIGSEFDIRIRYKLSRFIDWELSYARFWPGAFTSSFANPVALQPYFPQSYAGQTGTTNGLTGRPTDFIYMQITANAFGDGKPIDGNPATELFGFASPEPQQKTKPASWRDVYAGLNGGAAWSAPRSSVVAAPLGAAVASGPVAAASSFADGSNSLSGFVGGVEIGANWRFDTGFVAGVEADLRGVSGNTDTRRQSSTIAAGGGSFTNYGQRTATLNYLGTIRGRLGYLVTPALQIYGTGGLAYGGVTTNTALLTQPAGAASFTLANPVYRDSLVGWTAGGGVEWALGSKWSVKLEYLRYDLGAATASALAVQPSGAFQYSATTRTRFDGNLIQAGVNRHFDLGALVE
jgi:opacity protein-like surface antigen